MSQDPSSEPKLEKRQYQLNLKALLDKLKQRGITQLEISKAVGVADTHLSRMKNKADQGYLGTEILVKLAMVYGCSLDFLLLNRGQMFFRTHTGLTQVQPTAGAAVTETVSIPLLKSFDCLLPGSHDREEDAVGSIVLGVPGGPPEPGALFAVRLGNGCIRKGLRSGIIVGVDVSEAARAAVAVHADGYAVIQNFAGQAVLGWLTRGQENYLFEPAYPPQVDSQVLSPTLGSQFVGKVVFLIFPTSTPQE